jgi:hypothetical protein
MAEPSPQELPSTLDPQATRSPEVQSPAPPAEAQQTPALEDAPTGMPPRSPQSPDPADPYATQSYRASQLADPFKWQEARDHANPSGAADVHFPSIAGYEILGVLARIAHRAL